jgi:hypothetical protein
VIREVLVEAGGQGEDVDGPDGGKHDGGSLNRGRCGGGGGFLRTNRQDEEGQEKEWHHLPIIPAVQ